VYTALTREPIDVAMLASNVRADSDGAVLIFLGVVRDQNRGRGVTGMEYEAYEDMAASVLREIGMEASRHLGTDRIAILHRTGVLAVGEVSVGIAVSSPHREEAYRASRYVIEEIKVRLPVWKLEHYTDGERSWVPGHSPVPPGSDSSKAAVVEGGAAGSRAPEVKSAP
jgi:molybdopterin synthase catalytic subunit